jgi:predicted ester cyclase
VFTGSQQGPWRELEPTGRSVEVEEMMFFRFEDGLLVELWEVFDEHEMRRQLAGDG